MRQLVQRTIIHFVVYHGQGPGQKLKKMLGIGVSSNQHTYKVLDLNYDACVERARHLALEHGGLYIQERAYF